MPSIEPHNSANAHPDTGAFPPKSTGENPYVPPGAVAESLLPVTDASDLPPRLSKDSSFWGMTATQFLGAFNDNLFKQLVLLLCLNVAVEVGKGRDVYQPIAMAVFAIPFILFSGFAGFLADKNSKRTIVMLCKVAEIGIMLLGMIAFVASQRIGGSAGLIPIFVVLFLMGTHSAFFGPSKYGILPEMLQEDDLPKANGIIQMTTFLAIIFGTASAGLLMLIFAGDLWLASATCVTIAVLGTITARWIRKTPVAQPGLKLRPSSLFIDRETLQLFRIDRPLVMALLVYSLFWFLGGVVQPAVNAFGILELGLNDLQTSILVACLGIGIAAGCVLAGKLSKGQIAFWLVRRGAWGIIASLCVLTVLGRLAAPLAMVEWLARLDLLALGISAGLLAVPLQVFLQTRPPQNQKGRVIGAMNLITWIGICISVVFYAVCNGVLSWLGVPASGIFATTGALLLPVALFYHPRDEDLHHRPSSDPAIAG